MNRRGTTFETVAAVVVLAIGAVVIGWKVWEWSTITNYLQALEKRTVVEIDQLQTALMSYQDKFGEYPPCLGEAEVEVRKKRFMRHLSNVYKSASYGTEVEDFNRLRKRLMSDAANDGTGQQYNFRDDRGNIRAIDLETLDPAETLVFWLCGFPTPYDTKSLNRITSRLVFGFYRDREDPFFRGEVAEPKYEASRNRTDPLLPINEKHLVDNDLDGWLEYAPFWSSELSPVVPFVYFDAECYMSSTANQATIGTVVYPQDQKLAARRGRISPLAEIFDPTRPVDAKWHKPESFQIVCGGVDNHFGPPIGTEASARRIALWPAGVTYESPNGQNFSPRELADEEEDNLSNLDNAPLGTAMKRAK